jgi:hypothetical protein
MAIVPFLTAFGLGATVTAIIQAWLAKRAENSKRSFQERKECYVGLLEAYHRAAVEKTDEAAKNFAYWQMRCELVAPKQVRNAIVEIVNTNDDRERREIAHENLKDVLRKDLAITK